MSFDPEQSNNLSTLLALLLDGRMAPEDETQLGDLLRDNPDAQQIYLDYCWTHAMLRRELGGMGGVGGNEEGGMRNEELSANDECRVMNNELPIATGIVIDSQASVAPIYHPSLCIQHSYIGGALFSYLTAAVILSVGLVIAWAWKLPDHSQVVRQSVPLPSPSSTLPSFVGRITGMVDCQWEKKGTDPIGRNGLEGASHQWGLSPFSPVSLGDKFALASGLMEITYDTGAKVILQGPVTYEVESAAGGYLSVGKLTAKLEKGSGFRSQELEAANQKSEIQNHKLFSVRTPTATVTDIGTEFGVEVQESGATSASVFRGIIEVLPIATNGQRGQAVRLTENESAHVEKSENGDSMTVRRGEADPAAFVRVGQLPRFAEEQRLKPFQRWQAYSEQLRRDPSLLAYYDFQQKDGSPAVLTNVAGSGDTSLDGVVENATWATGRMAGKHALLFQNPTDHVRINLPQKIDDLTLAAWVCFDALDENETISGLLMSEDYGLHWQIANWDGHLSISSVATGDAKGWQAINSRQIHRWIHLACTYDHAAAEVRFYANGRTMGGADCPASEPIVIGPAWIGNWKHEPRNFRGRMDELAIFGRALTNEEVRKMHEQGSP